MGRYVVAKRLGLHPNSRTVVESVRDLPGVEIRGAGNADRVIIEASPQTASELSRRFGDTIIVEPEIIHSHV